MATKRVEKHNGTEENQEPTNMLEDRISNLPDAIILLILSFLPTVDAVRTCLLSKRWRHMWTSIPVLYLCDNNNSPPKKFFKFVNECLKRYADVDVTRFKLSMAYHEGRSHRFRCFRLPLRWNLKELDIQICARSFALSCLPPDIFHLRTLTLLKLYGVMLVSLNSPISLPSLKVLELWYDQIDDRMLTNLLLGAPSLEKLRLKLCSGLVDPQVVSLSLKFMEFKNHWFRHCKTITVEAPNLHSFVYDESNDNCLRKNCTLNLVSCGAIRNLLLSRAVLGDKWLEDLISQLPLLESLNLTACYGLKHIQIWNQQLKHITLSGDYGQLVDSKVVVAINTPNLISFTHHDGNAISMYGLSLCAPKLLNANIEINSGRWRIYDMVWYTDLISFLSELNCSKNVQISASNEKALIIPEELREIYSSPLPNLKNLKVKVKTGIPLFRKKLRNSLLWLSPSLDTLSIGYKYL